MLTVSFLFLVMQIWHWIIESFLKMTSVATWIVGQAVTHWLKSNEKTPSCIQHGSKSLEMFILYSLYKILVHYSIYCYVGTTLANLSDNYLWLPNKQHTSM